VVSEAEILTNILNYQANSVPCTDPKQITINGGSAGAGSVRTLLGSPKAIGKFAGAWAMSNLGGGEDLGLGGNYVKFKRQLYRQNLL